MKKLLITILLSLSVTTLQAETINLECDALAHKMVTRFVEEGLLLKSDKNQGRARAISAELCQSVQKSAETQHKKAQTSALQNWIFENRPDKPGNKRLKRLK